MLQFLIVSIFDAPLFKNVDTSPFCVGLNGVGVVGANNRVNSNHQFAYNV